MSSYATCFRTDGTHIMATTTGEKRRISTGKKGRRYENDPRRALRGILSLSQSGRLLKKMRAMGKPKEVSR